MFRPTLLCLLLLMSSASRAQQGAPPGADAPQAEVLTLERAVALALENNREVRGAQLEAAKADDRLAAMRTRRLPALSLNLLGSQLLTPLDFHFPQGVFGTFSGIGPIPAANTKISTPLRPFGFFYTQASQPLSQLYKIGLGIHISDLDRRVESQKLRARKQAVVNDVRRLYYALLETQSGIEALEGSLQFTRELDRVMGDYVVEKIALTADSLEVKARLAREEYEALTLRDELASREEEMNHLLGRDIRVEFRVEPVPEASALEVDLPSAQTRALASRPDVAEARLKLEQAESQVRLKKAEYLPDLSFTVNYLGIANVELVPKNTAAAGFSLTWDPLTWGRREREVAEKRKTVEEARLSVREAESRVLMDVNMRFRSLREARALLRATALARQAAHEKTRTISNRFAEKSVLLKDVLQSKAALAEAQHDYQRALLRFWSARADYDKAIGRNEGEK